MIISNNNYITRLAQQCAVTAILMTTHSSYAARIENDVTFTDIEEQEIISICTFPYNNTTRRLLFYTPYILFSLGFIFAKPEKSLGFEHLYFTSTTEEK